MGPGAAGGGGGGGVGLEEAILALSPDGFWKLDEASGISAADSSGNAKTGSYFSVVPDGGGGNPYGDPTPLWTAGTSQRVTPGATPTNNDSPFTFFGMFKPSELVAGLTLCSKWSSGTTTRQYLLQMNTRSAGASGYGLQAYMTSGNGATVVRNEQSVDGLWTAGQWHAFAATSSGKTSTSDWKMYLDSDVDRSTDLVDVGTGNTGNASTFNIGALGTGGANWRGEIAYCATFNPVLTDEEIGTLMAAAANDGWI